MDNVSRAVSRLGSVIVALCVVIGMGVSAEAHDVRGVGFCEPGQETCCVHPASVHFKDDLGLSFVVIPSSVEMNYAAGFCPRQTSLLPKLGTPGLYGLASMLPADHPAYGLIPDPTCVPVKMKPLWLWIKVDGKLVRERMHNVIVEEAGCR